MGEGWGEEGGRGLKMLHRCGQFRFRAFKDFFHYDVIKGQSQSPIIEVKVHNGIVISAFELLDIDRQPAWTEQRYFLVTWGTLKLCIRCSSARLVLESTRTPTMMLSSCLL